MSTNAETCETTWHQLLMFPAASSKYRQSRAKTFLAPKDQVVNWADTSQRWKQTIKNWLDSKQFMTNTKGMIGDVFTYHPSLRSSNEGVSKVYIGLCRADGREVAIKVGTNVVNSDEVSIQTATENFVNEVATYQARGSMPGVVRYITSWIETKENSDDNQTEINLFVVLELMEGTLEDLLSMQREDGTHFWYDAPPSNRLKVVQYVLGSVLTVLNDLTNGDIGNETWVHRDIKPSNIMIDCRQRIRLIDFETAQKWLDNKTAESRRGGHTVPYAPPEFLWNDKQPMTYTTSDIFSLGLVFYRLMNPVPWLQTEKPTPKDIETLAFPDTWPSYRIYAARNLLQAMLQPDPRERGLNVLALKSEVINAHELLLAHPFFWSAQKSLAFLMAVRCSDRKWRLENNCWFSILPLPVQEYCLRHNLVSSSEEDRTNPVILLHFIFYYLTHMYDQDYPEEISDQLENGVKFLEWFPHLVYDCWFMSAQHLRHIINEPLMVEFFMPFQPTLHYNEFDT
jgi:serine/threonine protein kinase